VIEPVGKRSTPTCCSTATSRRAPPGRGEGQLLINLAPDTEIDEGDDIQIVMDRENIHLFDQSSGEAITHSLE